MLISLGIGITNLNAAIQQNSISMQYSFQSKQGVTSSLAGGARVGL